MDESPGDRMGGEPDGDRRQSSRCLGRNDVRVGWKEEGEGSRPVMGRQVLIDGREGKGRGG